MQQDTIKFKKCPPFTTVRVSSYIKSNTNVSWFIKGEIYQIEILDQETKTIVFTNGLNIGYSSFWEMKRKNELIVVEPK